jgi:LPS export ABC transporter protein LptC
MKLSRKTIIISLIIVVSIALLIFAATKINSKLNKPKNLLKVLQDSVDLEIKGFVYTEVGKSNAKWEIKAETATYDKKENLAVMNMVKIKLTTTDGKVFTMSADKGNIQTEKKNIEIEKNVVIVSDTGDKFFTDHLSYSDTEKKFYTDAPVTMENKRMKLTGKGLTIFMNKGELNIPSMVKAKIN